MWTGRAAISRGLVDALGGVATAVEMAKERVRLAAGADCILWDKGCG